MASQEAMDLCVVTQQMLSQAKKRGLDDEHLQFFKNKAREAFLAYTNPFNVDKHVR